MPRTVQERNINQTNVPSTRSGRGQVGDLFFASRGLVKHELNHGSREAKASINPTGLDWTNTRVTHTHTRPPLIISIVTSVSLSAASFTFTLPFIASHPFFFSRNRLLEPTPDARAQMHHPLVSYDQCNHITILPRPGHRSMTASQAIPLLSRHRRPRLSSNGGLSTTSNCVLPNCPDMRLAV